MTFSEVNTGMPIINSNRGTKMKTLLKIFFLSTALLGLLALPALGAECPRGDLDKRYCDVNGDLIADTPTDSSKLVDPST